MTAAPAVPLLSRAIADFVTRLSRASMSESSASPLATLLRVQRYYDTCGELAPDIAGGRAVAAELLDGALRTEILAFLDYAGDLLTQLNPDNEPFSPAGVQQMEKFEARYQHLKAVLLAEGARGEMDMDTMESLLRRLSVLHRILDQAAKAARLLAPAGPENMER